VFMGIIKEKGGNNMPPHDELLSTG